MEGMQHQISCSAAQSNSFFGLPLHRLPLHSTDPRGQKHLGEAALSAESWPEEQEPTFHGKHSVH